MGWTRRALASRSRKPAWGCENFVVLIACLYRSGLKKHIDTNRAGNSFGHNEWRGPDACRNNGSGGTKSCISFGRLGPSSTSKLLTSETLAPDQANKT